MEVETGMFEMSLNLKFWYGNLLKKSSLAEL